MLLVALIFESLLAAVILLLLLIVTLSPAVMSLTLRSALPVMSTLPLASAVSPPVPAFRSLSLISLPAVRSTSLALIVPVMSLSEVTFKVSPTVAVSRLRLSVVSVKFFAASIVTDLLPVFTLKSASCLALNLTSFGVSIIKELP